jgi:hypothetical protein
MQSTLTLLDKALAIAPMPVWAQRLGVHRNALRNARASGHLTPVLAGNLALELQENPEHWIAVAVVEGEKPSPAKDALAKRLAKAWLNT